MHYLDKLFRMFYPHGDAVQVKREFSLPENVNFSLRVTPDGWFVVTMPDQPGLVTEANSRQGLLEMVNDALLTYYDVPRRKADIVYDRLNVGNEVIQYQGQLQTQKA
mgnify:CR=1 FL=1